MATSGEERLGQARPAQRRGQALDRGAAEQRSERQVPAEALADAGHERHREQRVAAEVEEAVAHADRPHLQELLPEADELQLERVARRQGALPACRDRCGPH